MFLHLLSFGFMLSFTLLFWRDLSRRTLAIAWVAFFLANVLLGFLLHAPVLAGVVKIAISLALLAKARLEHAATE